VQENENTVKTSAAIPTQALQNLDSLVRYSMVPSGDSRLMMGLLLKS
jgi:hypothetical protein